MPSFAWEATVQCGDLVDNPDCIALIESFYDADKPVAAVCHAPALFHSLIYRGDALVKGKRVMGFSNGEEVAVNLTDVVPFLVEDELKRIGGTYQKAADWAPFAVVDGRVVTARIRLRRLLWLGHYWNCWRLGRLLSH
jgi:putative intracellular protease/amidase